MKRCRLKVNQFRHWTVRAHTSPAVQVENGNTYILVSLFEMDFLKIKLLKIVQHRSLLVLGIYLLIIFTSLQHTHKLHLYQFS